jgi:GAF domain-containing protein
MTLTRYKVIADMAANISSSTGLEDVLAVIAQQAAEAFDIWECVIYDYDRAARTATPLALWTRGPSDADDEYLGTPIPLETLPALGHVLEQESIVETLSNDPTLSHIDREAMARWDELSCLWVPLLLGGEPIGCLEMTEKRYIRPFTDYDHEFAVTVAALAGMAIHNARSRRREEAQERRLEILLRASRDLALASTERELLESIARTTGTALEAGACYIYLYHAGDATVEWVATWARATSGSETPDAEGTSYRLDEYGADRTALIDGEIVERLVSDPFLPDEQRRELEEWGFRTVVTVPAFADGVPVGMLEITESDGERHFTADELDLARALAEQAAVVLKRRMTEDESAG